MPTDTPTTPPLQPLLLDPAGVAQLLGVSRAKIFQLIRLGSLPPAIRSLGPRCPRWIRPELEQWILNHCPRPKGG